MEKKKILPPRYFMGSVVAICALHFIFPAMILFSYPWNLIGILPLIFGIALNLLADQAFKKLGTTVKPFEKSSVLVKDGVFKISRHPMYLGMVLILVGITVFLGTIAPFLVVIVFTIIMQKVFINAEENMMKDTFGDEYLEYKSRVRKWY